MRYVCFLQKQHYGFRCNISWLTLLTDTDSCHTYFFPACGLESDRTSQIRLPGDIRALVQMIPASSDLIKAVIIPEFRNFMVTKRFSRTDGTENQSCLQLLRRCTYQVTSRLSSCLTTTLLTCQLISLLAKHSACLSWNFIAMNFIIQSPITNASSPFKASTICRLYWSWFSALRICPLHSKILAEHFLLHRNLPNCIVYSEIAPFTSSRTHFSFSRSSHFTLWLWLHTFWKSVSPASLSVKTLQWSAHLLSSSSQWLRYVVFKYNLLSWSLFRTSLH